MFEKKENVRPKNPHESKQTRYFRVVWKKQFDIKLPGKI